jgi:hypothetical protein
VFLFPDFLFFVFLFSLLSSVGNMEYVYTSQGENATLIIIIRSELLLCVLLVGEG